MFYSFGKAEQCLFHVAKLRTAIVIQAVVQISGIGILHLLDKRVQSAIGCKQLFTDMAVGCGGSIDFTEIRIIAQLLLRVGSADNNRLAGMDVLDQLVSGVGDVERTAIRMRESHRFQRVYSKFLCSLCLQKRYGTAALCLCAVL